MWQSANESYLPLQKRNEPIRFEDHATVSGAGAANTLLPLVLENAGTPLTEETLCQVEICPVPTLRLTSTVRETAGFTSRSMAS